MTEAIKPCPFCGGIATFDHDDDGWHWIVCMGCGACTNCRASVMEDCKPLLAEQWNRRSIIDGPGVEPVSYNWTHFDIAYRKACNTSQVQDWLDAALLAQQVRNQVPSAPVQAAPDETVRAAVQDAIADALGSAYDCTRVWEAWSVGTMGQDDFALIRDDDSRLYEIADAAINAMLAAAQQPPKESGE